MLTQRSPAFWGLVMVGLAVAFWLVGWSVANPAGTGGWQMAPCTMMPWGYAGGFGTSAMLLMTLSTLLFWAGLITGLVLLVRWLATPNGQDRLQAVEPVAGARRYTHGAIRQEDERFREDQAQQREER